VVIGIDHHLLSSIRAHERVHVRQYERWGVFFFPLYVASSVAQLIRGAILSGQCLRTGSVREERCAPRRVITRHGG
jgi:hypothetical protein